MNEDEFTNASGYLDVGNGHKIWYMDWGNPKSKPIFWMHGGPGSSTSDSVKLIFDPKVHRVIFHDQRGCGQSTPLGGYQHNSTQDLVRDIEKLRKTLEIKKIMLGGSSWGVCLALAYAITYPAYVSKLLLQGIFTGTKPEIDYFAQGGLKNYFPEAWQQFIEVVPKNRQHEINNFYFEKITADNQQEALAFAKRLLLLESPTFWSDSDYNKDMQTNGLLDVEVLPSATIEAYYFVNNCFLPDNYVIKNINKIKHIPAVLVQGRHDHTCPPETAIALAAAWGESCHLHISSGGHAREGGVREALKAYAWSFLR